MRGYHKKQARRFLKTGYIRKGYHTDEYVNHYDLCDCYITEIIMNEPKVAKEILRIGWQPYSKMFSPLQIVEYSYFDSNQARTNQ